MGVVKGAISIKDNMSAVLRSIKQEQSAFRRDVQRTRRELESTWDRRRTARLDATAANRAAQQLRQRLEPLRKKIVTAVAIKDMVSDKIKAVGNKVKAVGKMIATPIVKLKDGVTAGISKIKSQLTSLAKTVAIPVTLAGTVVLGGAISQGAALEQSIGGVETLFKDNAGVVKANADAAFRTAGLSANAYMEQVTSFSASLISSLSGDTAKAATVADMAMIDMADNANKFGTDSVLSFRSLIPASVIAYKGGLPSKSHWPDEQFTDAASVDPKLGRLLIHLSLPFIASFDGS